MASMKKKGPTVQSEMSPHFFHCGNAPVPSQSEGIGWSKRVGWYYYHHFNKEKKPDVMIYCTNEDEARQKLEAEKAKRQPQISTP